MSKKKLNKSDSKVVNEPLTAYGTNRIKIFKSFEEQDEYEMQQMAKLSGIEILQQLRLFINRAYQMHGYDPDKLPQNHTIKILSNPDEHI